MDVVPSVDERSGSLHADVVSGGGLRAHLPCFLEVPDAADTVPGASLLVHRGHGERAMSAASLRQRAGHDDVAVPAGGPDEPGELETGAGA